MLIQDGMQILVRTEEEWRALVEVANKEYIRWSDGSCVRKSENCIGTIFVGSWTSKRLTRARGFNHEHHERCTNIIEASDLFRNQIISRRIKEG